MSVKGCVSFAGVQFSVPDYNMDWQLWRVI